MCHSKCVAHVLCVKAVMVEADCKYLFDVFAFEILFTVVLVLSESEQLMLLLLLQLTQFLRVPLLQSNQLLIHSRL